MENSTKFYNYMKDGLSRVGILIKNYPVLDKSNLKSTKNLYFALTTYFSLIIDNLKQYSTQALHGLYAPDKDDPDAIQQYQNNVKAIKRSSKKFNQIKKSKLIKTLKNCPSSKAPLVEKKLLTLMSKAKYFFMDYKDNANPSYKNKNQYYSILETKHHKFYTNKLTDFYDNKRCIRQYSEQISHPKELKIKENKELHNSHSALGKQLTKKIYNLDLLKSALKDAKNEYKRDKEIIHNILSKHNLLTTTPVKVVSNPDANDNTDSPRVVNIEGIKMFYNPKDVSLSRILDMNIPWLPCDQDEYWVGPMGDDKTIVEY